MVNYKNKMKKILIITLSLSEKNGLGRYSRDLVKRLCHRYQLIIFSGKEEDDLGELPNCQIFRELPGMFNFFRLRHPALLLFYIWRIVRVAKKVDFIHSFMDYPYSFLAALVSLFLRKPFFITAHGTYSIKPFRLWPDKYFHRFTLRRAQKITCISRFTEKEIKKRIKLSNTVIINDGIDFEKFNRSGLTRISTRKDKIILGVGILKARKGYHISIPAVAEVKKKYPNIKYYIVGYQASRNYFNELKDLVKKYDLKENVIFAEKISDEELIDLYYSADLFLLTPINTEDNFEGFGLVYLEAGACGKPVIGTYGCGAEDAIIDGVTGILVPQNDIGKTVEAILSLLNNPELAQKMGEDGKKRAREMNWDNVAKKYIEVYKEIL
jgi:phosphatidylinositol alpha-1,6-mannosyltransferase